MITQEVHSYIKENGPSTAIQIANKTGYTIQQARKAANHLSRSGYLHQTKIKHNSRIKNVYSVKADYVPHAGTIGMRPGIYTDTTRKCSKCGEVKPFDEFHKNAAQRYGVNNTCKACSGLIYGDAGLTVIELFNWWHSPTRINATVFEAGPLDTPCLIWQKSMSGNANTLYGQATINYHLCRVHRIALIVKLGRHIQDGMTASHLCLNSRCCEPTHLIEETQINNMRRGLQAKKNSLDKQPVNLTLEAFSGSVLPVGATRPHTLKETN